MTDILKDLPSMQYNQVVSEYYNDFHLSYFFDKHTGERMLADIYQEAV